MKLYHFCSERHLHGILRDGLTKGSIPTFHGCEYVPLDGYRWLTRNPSWSEQAWATSVVVPYSRTDYRLTVKIPASSRHNLTKWAAVRGEFNEETQAAIEAAAGHEDWFVYRGRIRPGWIRRVDKSPALLP